MHEARGGIQLYFAVTGLEREREREREGERERMRERENERDREDVSRIK
jgi:hypothetical protein